MFDTVFFNTGGAGARPTLDGLSATAFPSGVKAMPVEVVEHGAPIVVWKKELLPDSGGAGKHRGGLGVRVVIGARDLGPISLLAMFERVDNVARGRAGGRPGGRGGVYLQSGETLNSKGLQVIPAGDRLVLETPGGAGYGDPQARSVEALRSDLLLGLVSPAAAKSQYATDALPSSRHRRDK
jgi:N-methylhydantoinase B